MGSTDRLDVLEAELEELKIKLADAEHTIEAIAELDIDALVVHPSGRRRVMAIQGGEPFYRLFVERMQEGALTVNSEGLIRFANPSFASIVGQSLTDLIGTPLTEALNPADVHRFEQLFEQGRKKPIRDEIIIQPKGMDPFPILVAIQPALNFEEDVCMVLTDLTERVANEKIRVSATELERMVNSRSVELANKNKELEGFTYSVSHDMRTSLRAIIALSRIVLEDEQDGVSEEGKANLTEINRSSLKLGMLIDDLLGYARLGRVPIKKQSVRIGALIKRVAEEFKSDASIHVEIPSDLRADCDALLIETVLHNFFENACKYREQGRHTVIECGIKKDGDTIAYFVRDNGIGFDMAYAPKLFKPFERLHRDGQFPGTGIGLANVKRIIERHGGVVWAEGEPGVGATFYFTLPAARK